MGNKIRGVLRRTGSSYNHALNMVIAGVLILTGIFVKYTAWLRRNDEVGTWYVSLFSFLPTTG